MHADVRRMVREKVALLGDKLGEELKPFQETFRRLQTVAGVGLITAAAFIAVVGTPERFADSGRVISYIGLVPTTWDTGEAQRHGHITIDLFPAEGTRWRLSVMAREAGRAPRVPAGRGREAAKGAKAGDHQGTKRRIARRRETLCVFVVMTPFPAMPGCCVPFVARASRP